MVHTIRVASRADAPKRGASPLTPLLLSSENTNWSAVCSAAGVSPGHNEVHARSVLIEGCFFLNKVSL